MVVANEKHQRVGAGGGRPGISVPSPASVVKKKWFNELGTWNLEHVDSQGGGGGQLSTSILNAGRQCGDFATRDTKNTVRGENCHPIPHGEFFIFRSHFRTTG